MENVNLSLECLSISFIEHLEIGQSIIAAFYRLPMVAMPLYVVVSNNNMQKTPVAPAVWFCLLGRSSNACKWHQWSILDYNENQTKPVINNITKLVLDPTSSWSSWSLFNSKYLSIVPILSVFRHFICFIVFPEAVVLSSHLLLFPGTTIFIIYLDIIFFSSLDVCAIANEHCPYQWI